MASPRKFSREEQQRLFTLLETPFSPTDIKWRVVCKGQGGRRGKLLPYVDPRTYTDRLNQLFTPTGWSRVYTLATVSNVLRRVGGRDIATGKIVVSCVLTIHRLGSHSGSGEEWADSPMAATAAEAQSFKRASSCFGLGRYLYRIPERWVDLDKHGIPCRYPALPHWALPPDVVMHHDHEPKGPIDPKLTGQIEGFRSVLGNGVYSEILNKAGYSYDARLIPNAVRQRDVLKWMERAKRGFERIHRAAGNDVEDHLENILQHMRLQSVLDIPNLEALRFVVDTLESVLPTTAA